MFVCRARSTNRNRQLFNIPEQHDLNSANDTVINSVVAWSFYPKLLIREGKGWRNVANNQAVTLHPTSINKHADPAIKWLSYYHIMQARNRNLNAHETSAVDDFAIALLCGEAEFKVRDPLVTILCHMTYNSFHLLFTFTSSSLRKHNSNPFSFT
jgi:ATP-dependent RNA helicase DHX29